METEGRMPDPSEWGMYPTTWPPVQAESLVREQLQLPYQLEEEELEQKGC